MGVLHKPAYTECAASISGASWRTIYHAPLMPSCQSGEPGARRNERSDAPAYAVYAYGARTIAKISKRLRKVATLAKINLYIAILIK